MPSFVVSISRPATAAEYAAAVAYETLWKVASDNEIVKSVNITKTGRTGFRVGVSIYQNGVDHWLVLDLAAGLLTHTQNMNVPVPQGSIIRAYWEEPVTAEVLSASVLIER